jgi:hypothetical protein
MSHLRMTSRRLCRLGKLAPKFFNENLRNDSDCITLGRGSGYYQTVQVESFADGTNRFLNLNIKTGEG